MARRRRHKASNSWFGHPRQHATAARLGWRSGHKGRRKHRNAGAQTLSLSHPLSAATSAFDYSAMKQVGWLIGGNLITTWSADKLMNMISILKTNSVSRAGTKLLMAGLSAGAVKKWVSPGHANDVLSGGMLSAVTGLLRETWPNYFGGLSDGEGMDDFDTPFQTMSARQGTSGIGNYANPNEIAHAGFAGVDDYASFPQTVPAAAGGRLVTLDGLQEEITSEMIASTM